MAATAPEPAPDPKVAKFEQRARTQAAVLERTAVKLSRLDTVYIYGKRIGDCTVGEVKAWADQRETEMREAGRDVRFARSLVANLDSGARIRDWWGGPREAEVDEIYNTAEGEFTQPGP
jgi:hypothetical protein